MLTAGLAALKGMEETVTSLAGLLKVEVALGWQNREKHWNFRCGSAVKYL